MSVGFNYGIYTSATHVQRFSLGIFELFLWQSLILLYMATICVYFGCSLKFARLFLGKEVYKTCH